MPGLCLPVQPNPGNVSSFTASAFPGTYSVIITNTTTGCTGSGSGTLSSGTPPVVTLNPMDVAGCKTGGSNTGVTFTATSTGGSPAPTAQWQVSGDNTTYVNVTTGTTNTTTTGGVTTSSYTVDPVSQGDLDLYYRVVFTNPCGTATSTGAFLSFGNSVNVIPGQNNFDVQFIACNSLIACATITYNSPSDQNFIGWVHSVLEIGPTNAGPWTVISPEDSSLGPGQHSRTACIPFSSANNGWFLQWRLWNYSCESHYQYTFPVIVYTGTNVTAPNSCVGGGNVTFTYTGAPPGGTWSVNGGGTINSSSGVFTPTTVGCWSATYTTPLPNVCTGSKEFIVFPAVPVIAAPPNTCGSAFTLPTVTAVPEFTVQYSLDGGVSWSASPVVPTTPGCYSIQARYVTSAACGSIPAGTAPTGSCAASNIVNVVIFPAAPTITAPANTCNAAFTLPTVSPVSGFTVQYSIDGGAFSASPSTATPGCHTVQARYVITATCGSTTAGSAGPAACAASNTVNVVIFPNAPTITAPANTCNAMFTLPTVSAVSGFNIQYSIDGGAFSASPSTTTPGCHTVQAQYVLASACGGTAANTTGSGSCGVSNTVSVVIFPTAPTLTPPINTCASAFTLPSVPTVAGFTIQYNIDGSGFTATPIIPTTPDCHTIQARYILSAVCGSTAAGATGPGACAASNTVSVVIFPATPSLVQLANTCNSKLADITAIAVVSGFTAEYAVQAPGGSLSAYNSNLNQVNNLLSNTPGCWTIKARYSLSSNCGSTSSGSTSASASCQEATMNAVVFPPAPPAPTVSPGCGAFTVTPPTSVAGFSIEYSFDDGGSWGPNTPPTADNCAGYKIRTRYVTSANCGSTSAGTASTVPACAQSPAATRIVDNTPPTIGTTGADATIECTATPSFTAPTASDACSVPTVNLLSSTTTGNSCLRVITRSWDATDACGNHSATRTQVITVVDSQAPTIGNAGSNATIECTATPSFTQPTASDACNGATVNFLGEVTAGNSCSRTITRSWDATDACGNHSATRAQIITVVDTQAPTIGNAGNNATIECTATPSFTQPTASDACNGTTVNLISSTTTGNCSAVITRIWDATDACGNHSATRTQIITVRDTQAPTIGQAGANSTVECTATPSFTQPTASDACNGATVNFLGEVTVGNSCSKTFTRTWDATDACGNHSATRTQVITVVDTQAPTIGTAGIDATIECTATPLFTQPTASDACNGTTVNFLGEVTAGNGCSRSITRRWDATDACGNHSATRTQVITVIDTQAPTIGNAGNNATIECTATPSFTQPTASDACNGATVNFLGEITAGNGCSKTVTRSWDATDACGNHSATRTQVITIVDTQAPTIGSAGSNATIECTASPSFTQPTASDACNGATVNLISSTTTGSCPTVITRSWDAMDACGNHSATRTQVITIVDTQAPTIGNAGSNTTIECTASPSFTQPTASDACSGATVTFLGEVTAGNSCSKTITRSWDATDACGNHSATRTQVITVVDTQAPTIGNAGSNATIECTATPSFTQPTASDACNGATVNIVSDITTAGSCAGTYSETRTWRAVDACGNQSATIAQTITVTDNTPPIIGTTTNATISCPASPTFTPPTASDACSTVTVQQVSDVTTAGTCAGSYTQTRTWRAVDACGNQSSTVAQTITVIDNTPPVIGSPGTNGTVSCPSTPNFTAPTASDVCSTVSVQQVSDVTTAGTCAGSYTETRTWRAVDACGNQSGTVAQIITVVDNTPPVIGSPGANGTVSCPSTPNFTAPTASDVCSPVSVQQVSDVTTAGTCAGSYSETRTWRAVDACGNQSSTVAQTITVIDNTPPVIGSPGADGTVSCPSTPNFTAPTASDVCSTASVQQVSDVTTAGTCAGSYSQTRTWRAVDACGNQSGTVAQTITVIDNTPPVIGGQGSNTTIFCPATPSFTAPTASDVCGTASVQLLSDVSAAGTCAGSYTRTQTWRAVDACGNQSGTVAQTITVIDNAPPVIGGQGSNTTIFCPATPSFTAPTASDVCGTASVQLLSDVSAAGTCAGSYTRTQTWRAVDACGNQSGTVAQTITVIDNTPPVIGGQGSNTTIFCPATPSFTAPTASDVCGTASVQLLSDVSAAGTCAEATQELKHGGLSMPAVIKVAPLLKRSQSLTTHHRLLVAREAIQQYSVRPHHPLLHPPHRMYVVQQVCNSSVM
jgi:hypothetical protein